MPRTKVVYAVEMLHYLPLFIAQRFAPDFDYELAPDPGGDKSTFDMLMSQITEHEDVHFCVCDPMMVNLPEEGYSATSNDWPIVIGQLVQKVPFWAVNHKKHSFTEETGFREYSQLFAYPSPNTGYVLGKLLEDHLGKGSTLKLRANMPIKSDLGFCLSSPDSVVLEADILKITKFTQETRNEIVFNYPASNEYKPFCFTAIISTRKFLRTDVGRHQASTLIAALQTSLSIIHSDFDTALTAAKCRFAPKGFTDDVIRVGLKQLIGDEIFPKSLHVPYRAWRKSIHIQRQADPKFDYPSYSKFVDNTLAIKEHNKFLKRVAEGGRYFRLKALFQTPGVERVVKYACLLGLLVYPFAYAVLAIGRTLFLQRVLVAPTELWAVLHLLLATALIIFWTFRGRIFASLRINPTEWWKEQVGAVIVYLVADAEFVREILKGLFTP